MAMGFLLAHAASTPTIAQACRFRQGIEDDRFRVVNEGRAEDTEMPAPTDAAIGSMAVGCGKHDSNEGRRHFERASAPFPGFEADVQAATARSRRTGRAGRTNPLPYPLMQE